MLKVVLVRGYKDHREYQRLSPTGGTPNDWFMNTEIGSEITKAVKAAGFKDDDIVSMSAVAGQRDPGSVDYYVLCRSRMGGTS